MFTGIITDVGTVTKLEQDGLFISEITQM